MDLPSPTSVASLKAVGMLDLQVMSSPVGWLTDSCVRNVSIAYRESSSTPRHKTTKQITLCDVSWLSHWERDKDRPILGPAREFDPSVTKDVVGTILPYSFQMGEEYVHWVVIYVDFQQRGCILFDSRRNEQRAQHIEALMREFHAAFPKCFDNWDESFTFHVDTKCAQQKDAFSCGIYAVRNILDLLDHRRPISRLLTPIEIATFRTNGSVVLNKDIHNGYEEPIHPLPDDPEPKPKKGVQWGINQIRMFFT